VHVADLAGRPLRADARRNRELVLAAATRLFAAGGLEVTMESIAREAGVGVGTIYRHFPSRESLVEAAYRNELAAICAAAAGLSLEQAPVAALRAWMDRFVDYMTAKVGMAEALREVIASGADPFAESRAMLGDALAALLAAAAAEGAIRDDVRADDVLMSLSGIALAAGQPAQREQAGRMLDLLLDGLRFTR
jgi:AcrR family transcriptional regulator